MLRSFIMTFVLLGMLGMLSISSATHGFSGKVQQIPLLEQTQFTLKVVPNLGTRLIFPFILDNPTLKPPLNYKLTNSNDFAVARNLATLAGQNVFLITASGGKGAIGKLYMSIAGYHISINLVVSGLVDDHISDIYLQLTTDDRGFLMEHEIDRIKKNLSKSYQNRIKKKNSIIADTTMAAIIMGGTKRKNIKSLLRGGKESFNSADIYLDKFLYLKPDAYAIHFWVEHYGEKFTISSMLVQLQHVKGGTSILQGKLLCLERGNRLDECLYITNDAGLIDDKMKLKITLTNNKDESFVINY